MNILYARAYASYWKEIREPLSIASTELIYRRRKAHAALLYENPICMPEAEYLRRDVVAARMPDGQTPFAVIEFENDYVGIDFFDDSVREYMTYQYIERVPNRLFLAMGVRRSFFENTDDVADGKAWHFGEDGSVIIKDFERRRESRLDVSAHWKAYPDFGQYEHLLDVDWASLEAD
jgi:hypothetical protein